MSDATPTIPSKQVRVDLGPLNELIERGKEITHKPDPTPNDALYAVLGRLNEAEKELKSLKRKMELPISV